MRARVGRRYGGDGRIALNEEIGGRHRDASEPQRPEERLDDALLVSLGQLRIERQRQRPFVVSVGTRQRERPVARLIIRLPMQRYVVDLSAYPGLAQRF